MDGAKLVLGGSAIAGFVSGVFSLWGTLQTILTANMDNLPVVSLSFLTLSAIGGYGGFRAAKNVSAAVHKKIDEHQVASASQPPRPNDPFAGLRH